MIGRIDVPTEALVRVRALHARVDDGASAIAARLGDRLRCRRGCSACCVDDLTVSRAEAAAIVDAFPHVLAGGPAPAGACSMLDDEGACRVYAARPYVCRTQGLPLRWIEEESGAGHIERRDICEMNEAPGATGEARPLEALDAASCWTVGRAELALAAIDRLAGDGAGARVGLRDLFAR